MPLVDIYEEKWFLKARAAVRAKWVRMIKSADSLEAFIKGIAAVTGLSESEVAASLPVKNWKEFQANAEKYVDILLSKLEEAHRNKKWAKNYVDAFRAR